MTLAAGGPGTSLSVPVWCSQHGSLEGAKLLRWQLRALGVQRETDKETESEKLRETERQRERETEAV